MRLLKTDVLQHPTSIEKVLKFQYYNLTNKYSLGYFFLGGIKIEHWLKMGQ